VELVQKIVCKTAQSGRKPPNLQAARLTGCRSKGNARRWFS